MKISCPHCNSTNVSNSSTRQHAIALIGGIIGAAIGFKRRCPSDAVGIPSGRLMGLIFGAVSGYNSGYALGKEFERQAINNYLCHSCFLSFST